VNYGGVPETFASRPPPFVDGWDRDDDVG